MPGVTTQGAGEGALLIQTANLLMPGPDGEPVPSDVGSSFTILDQVHTCALPPDAEEASSKAAAPAPASSGGGTQPSVEVVADENAFYAALQRVAADSAAARDGSHMATIVLQGAPYVCIVTKTRGMLAQRCLIERLTAAEPGD